MNGAVLFHAFLMEIAGYHRFQVQRFQTDDFVIQFIRLDGRSIDFCFKLTGETVCPMPLLRDREGLLPAGYRRDRLSNLVTI